MQIQLCNCMSANMDIVEERLMPLLGQGLKSFSIQSPAFGGNGRIQTGLCNHDPRRLGRT
ncbi:hypothetical protein O9992_14880 [Vibrio lentus]|nr:hypothetical protein [Vibrio lentus]